MTRTFGVVGLGSMGKRRVRDLRALGYGVVGFDIREDRNVEATGVYGIETVATFASLLDKGVDAIVISTPPDVHAVYYERAYAARRPFFSEANIFTPPASWFSEHEAASGVRGYPSGTWRYHPLCMRLRERIGTDTTAVRTVSHQYGGFLPSWHPWEPYEEFYAGRWRTSAAREMIPFEMELLCWTFGRVRSVSATRARRAEWITPIDDTYYLLLDFESGVQGTMAIELHQSQPFRISRISMNGRSLTLDLGRHELEEYDANDEVYRRHRPKGMRALSSFNFEDVYLNEINAFARQLDDDGAFDKQWADDRHLSNVLWAAEESARRKAWVTTEEAEASYDGLAWLTEPEPGV